jgi:hypothetical protein
MKFLDWICIAPVAIACLFSQAAFCAAPNQAVGVVDVGAYGDATDGNRHILVSQDGAISEIAVTQNQGFGTAEVARIPNTIALDAFFARHDHNHQTAIVLQDDGDVEQVWFKAGDTPGSAPLGNIAGAIDVAGLEDNAGGQHALVLSNDGTVTELAWVPSQGITRRTLFTVSGATHLDAFQAEDDHYIIVHIASPDGTIREAFFQPGGNFGLSVITQMPEALVDVASYYSADDHFRHVVALGVSGTVFDFQYHPTLRARVPLKVVASFAGGTHLSAFWTPAAGSSETATSHAVVSTYANEVKEFTYTKEGGQNLGTLGNFPALQPTGEAVGPKRSGFFDGPFAPASPSAGGLVLSVAGNEAVKYAVSLNAGIWRSDGGAPWESMSNSPRYTQFVATMPGDVMHVFAGERDGDAAQRTWNRTGLWESRDGGVTWGFVLDPMALSPRIGRPQCVSQAVPSVAFGADGSVYAATDCGVVRRAPTPGSAFAFLPGLDGRGSISAVAVSNVNGLEWVWARTPTSILLRRRGILGYSATKLFTAPSTAPSAGGQTLTMTAGPRGSGFGFAAYGRRAAVQVMVSVPGKLSPRVASLELDPDATQPWWVDWVNSGTGTGLGGRVHLRSSHSSQFESRHGGRDPLLLLTAQKLYIGTPRIAPGGVRDDARGIDWRLIAESSWSDAGCASNPPTNDCYEFIPQSNVHSDFWDAHISEHPLGDRLLLGSDGGVSTSTLSNDEAAVPPTSPLWWADNSGFRTQHIHKLGAVVRNYTDRPEILTAAADNDGWWHPRSWRVLPEPVWYSDSMGDVNWLYANPVVDSASLLWRHGSSNLLLDLTPASPQNLGGIAVYPGGLFRSEQNMSVVERGRGQGGDQTLEVLALARSGGPITDQFSRLCGDKPAPTDGDGSQTPTLLMRTTDYKNNRVIASPDPTKGTWSVDSSNVPVGAQRVWVSETSTTEVVYLFVESDPSGNGQIFRRRSGETQWTDITTNITGGLPARPFCSANGPLFVHPTNSNILYVQGPAQILQSTNQGDGFQPDTVLQSLLTRSQTYPFVTRYNGGNSSMVGDSAGHNVHESQGRALTTMSCLAADPLDDYRIVVTSAFGGAFFKDTRMGVWQDLSEYLPRPISAISSAAINHDGVYVSLEGHSVWKIANPEFAPEATYFRDPVANDLGVLMAADQTVVANALVDVLIRESGPCVRAPSDCLPIKTTVTTGSDGVVPIPGTLSLARVSGRIVELNSFGSKTLAPGLRIFVR